MRKCFKGMFIHGTSFLFLQSYVFQYLSVTGQEPDLSQKEVK